MVHDLVEVSSGRTRAWVRLGYERWALLLGLHGIPSAEMHAAGGRAPHPVVTLPTGERALVRQYLRGGMLRHVNRARYFGGHRALHEMLATEQARAAGVRSPVPLAAVEHRHRLGYTASLASLWIPEAHELAAWLRGAAPGEQRDALADTGEQVARMHAAGIAHPDLNLRNFVTSGGRVFILDFDRARLFGGSVPSERRARDLLRMARSARKLAVPLGGAEWEAFRRGYGASWPLRTDLG